MRRPNKHQFWGGVTRDNRAFGAWGPRGSHPGHQGFRGLRSVPAGRAWREGATTRRGLLSTTWGEAKSSRALDFCRAGPPQPGHQTGPDPSTAPSRALPTRPRKRLPGYSGSGAGPSSASLVLAPGEDGERWGPGVGYPSPSAAAPGPVGPRGGPAPCCGRARWRDGAAGRPLRGQGLRAWWWAPPLLAWAGARGVSSWAGRPRWGMGPCRGLAPAGN